MSPWADVESCAEQLGPDFVYARKPNPAHVAIRTDPDVIRREIEQTVKACQRYGCPCEFAEDALKGNFFWRGTEGATLSLNENDNAVYLTDRFDKEAFDDEAAFAEYINAFLRSVYDWRARLDGYDATKEASR